MDYIILHLKVMTSHFCCKKFYPFVFVKYNICGLSYGNKESYVLKSQIYNKGF